VITLGVDPGTAICGFGVVDFDGGSLRLVEAGCIRTDATETDAARLGHIVILDNRVFLPLSPFTSRLVETLSRALYGRRPA